MRKAHAKLQAFEMKCEQEDKEQEEINKRLFDDAPVPANVSVAAAPHKEKTVEELVDELYAMDRAKANDDLLKSGLQPSGKKTTGLDDDEDNDNDDDESEEGSKRSIPSRSGAFDQYTTGANQEDNEDDDGSTEDEEEEQRVKKVVQTIEARSLRR